MVQGMHRPRGTHEERSTPGQDHSQANRGWEDEDSGPSGWGLTMKLDLSLTVREDLSLIGILDLSGDCHRCNFHPGLNHQPNVIIIW